MTDWGMNDAAIRAGHKPYDPDSEYQPVRIAPVAPHTGPMWTDYIAKDRGKIIRVKPVELTVFLLAEMREGGCDGTRAYEIHPDDVRKLSDPYDGPHMLVCEHQIQAD